MKYLILSIIGALIVALMVPYAQKAWDYILGFIKKQYDNNLTKENKNE